MQVPDFAHAFCTWCLKEQASYGRFQVEALLETPDNLRYMLTSGVMAADVYGAERLILDPPYEFMAVFGPTHYRVFRTHAPVIAAKDSITPVGERFASLVVHLPTIPADALTDTPAIIRATLDHRPLVARLELADTGTLWCPVKHLNVQTDTEQFQVETGPVLLPDASRSPCLEALRPAFVVFNRLDRVEYILRTEVCIENVSVRHYADWHARPAHIRLFALPNPGDWHQAR